MLNTRSIKASYLDTVALLKLAIPLILSGIVQSSVGFTSTFFLAQLSVNDLAAGSLVSRMFVTIMVMIWGTLFSVSVLVANKRGAKDKEAIVDVLRDGIFLGIILVIPASIFLWNITSILLWAGQDPAIVMIAQPYIHALVWGFLPDFVGLVLIQFLIGLGHTRTNLVYSLFWVPCNIFFNYIFMFGKLGLPVYGIEGIGWGTTVAYWVTTLALLFYFLPHRYYRSYFKGIFQFKRTKYLGELWSIGFPMGLLLCVELGFFLTITLMMGQLSTEILAAYQITLQYLIILSMVYFGIAEAVTVRIAHQLGANQINLINRIAMLGILIATVCMSVIAVIYYFFPERLIGLDLDMYSEKNAAVVSYAKQFFTLCALFQLVQATGIVLRGALRGLKETRFTLMSSVFCLWVVGIPVGYYLSHNLQWGGNGLWWGMIIGALLTAVLLYLKFQSEVKKLVLEEDASLCYETEVL
ncbi:MAG: MATE family efflux transporter [Gammaproteobacteria bacterium]|nr:MATE family efflux transporter [Gammaproteobacteria bacterium]